MTASDSGNAATLPKVEYVIFDMDGLMLDSERIYTDVTNNILAEYGQEMTWDMKAGLMGMPERQATEHLLSFFPGISLTPEEYIRRRNEQQDILWPDVQPLPGVVKLVEHFAVHKIPMIIATGSKRKNFDLKTLKLGSLFRRFIDSELVICGDDSRVRNRGKPAPDIFLLAARTLGRQVGEGEGNEVSEGAKKERSLGLVFEDAIPGVQAAKRGGMNVVWVPDSNLLTVEFAGHRPDQTLRSLEDFKPESWGLPPFDE